MLQQVVIGFAALGVILLPVSLWLALRQRGRIPTRRVDLEAFRGMRRDTLTGLPARQSFGETLALRLHTGTPTALLVIDIDDFATINATSGHRVGDQVLAAAADRLRALMPDAGQLARLGSDEFGVLLDATPGPDTIEPACLQILRALMGPVHAEPVSLACSVSIGVALAPAHGNSEDRLMRAAQTALREAKAGGGGGWRIFNAEREAEFRQRKGLKDELRLAIQDGEIIPYYQPIVDLALGRVVGLEVLARWDHRSRGLLEPDLFIPLAEEMALCGALTERLMRHVIADARGWPAWLHFAFNVSPGQLRELIRMVRNPPAWQEGTLDPRRLEVEVTESALIEDVAVAREVIALLHARGTRIVLDDFGMGFSNMFHLRELPFDRIKVDRSFILNIAQDPRADACVRSMLALGQSLGIEMVAEGIDTASTAAYLAGLGCRYGQGFLYSEPVPGSGVTRLLQIPLEPSVVERAIQPQALTQRARV
jgi:diguanylate cyclase (GGDEF)-like protein